MYAIRITDPASNSGIGQAISNGRSNYVRQMAEISEGKKYLSRSDSPLDTSTVQALQTDDAANAQWSKNIDAAVAVEDSVASTIEGITKTMQRISELLAQGNSGIDAVSGRQDVATELNTQIETLVQYGNANYMGVPQFSGTATCVDKNGNPVDTPFTVDRDADGNITNVYFLGNQNPDVYPDTSNKTVAISSNAEATVGVLGEGAGSLFQYTTYENVGTEAVPDWQYVNVRLFDELIKLRDTLMNTTDKLDATNCSRIEAGVDNVIDTSVFCYASQAQLKTAAGNLDNVATATASSIDRIQGTNESDAVAQLYQVQNALQGSMNMLNTISGMSLINYI